MQNFRTTMKRISILLSTLFLLAGINANPQMHGDTHQNTQQDSSYMNNYNRQMHRGHMRGQGMVPFMMDGNMNAMHGMRGNGMMNRHGSGMMHYGMITHFPMLDEELDLSSTQVKRLNNMKEAFLEESDNLHKRKTTSDGNGQQRGLRGAISQPAYELLPELN